MRKVISGIGFVFLLVLLGSASVESVQASAVSFIQDSITVAEGDEIYLPYLIHTNQTLEFYTDDAEEDPIVWFISEDSSEDADINTIWANRPGIVTVYAVAANGDYDTMEIKVCERPMLDSDLTSQIGFQLGQTCRSYKLQVNESGKYRLFLRGPVGSGIVVYEEEYDLITEETVHSEDGNDCITSLDVMLEAGKSYVVDFYNWKDGSSFDAPESSVILSFSMGKVVYPSGISLLIDSHDPLRIEGDTYYYLKSDTINVHLKYEGGDEYVEYETYNLASTNSSVVYISGWTSFFCINKGIAEISVMTSSMHRDAVTIVVLNEEDIVPGDMNLDGAVNKADIELLYSMYQNETTRTRIYNYADLNADNVIDEKDIQMMWDIIGGLPYVDVVSADWFYKAVEFNYNEKIMTGMDQISFGPYNDLSRAQFALILYRMEGSPEINLKNKFKDIVGDEWYANAVLWANSVGIVNGFEIDGTFRPVDLITREQMVTMMYRYANYLEEDTTVKADYDEFIDADCVSGYAEDAMKWAVGNGILTGKVSDEGSMLAPWGATARAEAATIIQRFSAK